MFDMLSLFKNPPKKIHADDDWRHAAVTECADGVWDWDIENGQLYISPNLRELIGYREEETKEQPYTWWLEHIHPDDHTKLQKKIEEAHKAKSEFVYFEAVRLLCKSGNYIWIENHAKFLRNPQGEIIRIASVTTNISSQKFIQNQLRMVIAKQKKDAQSQMRFLSALNHEFRSPLSGIIGMITFLKETNLSPDQLHYVENMTNSTEMLLALVNDILDISKLNSGRFEFEKIRFSPAQALKGACDLIRPSLLKKNLTFHMYTNVDSSEFLIGDPTRLQQILVNLLSNAVKFTSTGSITLRVKEIPSKDLESSSLKHTLHFEISDTGIGIAPEVQETLFEDFTQANSSITRMYGGTGLGLSICKELVHLMGGEIGVRSQPNQGSTFWFTLPFDKAASSPTSQTVEIDPSLPQSGPHHKLNILVVEDNQVSQEVMCGLLKLLGDQVTVANNGEEAIHLFQTQKFDMVLMDLNMPILDGLSATQAIRKLPNGSVPVIAVTAHPFTEDQSTYHQYGITNVLNKPVNKSRLEQILQPYRSKTNTEITDAPLTQEEPSKSTLDHHTLKALITDLGKEKVIHLLTVYQNDAWSLVTQIKHSPPQDKKNYAHTLAGMSENLGIYLVGKTARDIIGATQHAPENLPLLIQDLEHYFENSLTEIQNMGLSPEKGKVETPES